MYTNYSSRYSTIKPLRILIKTPNVKTNINNMLVRKHLLLVLFDNYNILFYSSLNLIYTVFHCLSHIYNHYIHTWQLSFDQVYLRLFLLYKHLYNGTNDHTLYRFCLTYYTLPVMIRHRKITPNTPMPTAMISLVAIDTFIFFLFIWLFILRPWEESAWLLLCGLL